MRRRDLPKFLLEMLVGLPEYRTLQKLALKASARGGRVSRLGSVGHRNSQYDLIGISFGSTDSEAPTLAFFGGVHGVERIGTQVVLAFLHTVIESLPWDQSLQNCLKDVRLVFMPLINPVGMLTRKRSNPNRIDLNRNAPIEAVGVPRWFLPAGQRISPFLPWYRGKLGAPVETETQALFDFVRRETFDSKLSICIDVHSGYGLRDRLLFPYGRTPEPFGNLGELYYLKLWLDRVFPNHVYKFEPQAKNYPIHGDLWDYLYDDFRTKNGGDKVFLPICLEIGSWLWIKKNPLQILNVLGPFNPLTPHRLQRALRRHIPFFDFLLRSVYSSSHWISTPSRNHQLIENLARLKWYGKDQN